MATQGRTGQRHAQVLGNAGIKIKPVFSNPDVHPFDELTWEKRSAVIADAKGKKLFEQHDVEMPADWTQQATNIVCSKYFYGELDAPEREKSLKQLVHRVCRTIADWGSETGVFASNEDSETFYKELSWLCVNQYGAFNSPVWFNVGLHPQYGIKGGEGGYFYNPDNGKIAKDPYTYTHPQASACFIQSVDDTMEDIMHLATAEAMLFKHGSGTGTDLSTLRSSREKLSGGGQPSGPLSFMRIYDQIAAVVRSGGKTRRAAKMQSLKVTHPDIEEFIVAKPAEEKKAWALAAQGYSADMDGEAYSSVMFQNSNFSIRVTDDFMRAVENDEAWQTRAVTTDEPIGEHSARDLWKKIADGTHLCGDPGVQYDSTINRWHTCPNSGPINASNPCSEYMFVDDSACNLASLNLMKFRNPDGTFDVERFRAAVRIFVIAQEILVDSASYPVEKIAMNSHRYRPLGLGYANLGALVMSCGHPYDSEAGGALAGAVTALLTGQAYRTSAELAEHLGTFSEYAQNADPMMRVIRRHRECVDHIEPEHVEAELLIAARQAWDDAIEQGREHGFRNAQVSVLAPTGTIGFMMDCDTTGIEPEMALVKYKSLAGGGMMKIVNQTVSPALEKLGYSDEQIEAITAYIEKNDRIEGAPGLAEKHLDVFDCAFRAPDSERLIHYMGHLRMMAAVQPFISGAISKTVNVPGDISAEEIAAVYAAGWKMGIKALAIYRDGSKKVQPVSTKKEADASVETRVVVEKVIEKVIEYRPVRRRLPDTRKSLTHKFEVQGHEGYLTVGLNEDGNPGELFITMAKEGSTVGGLMDAFGTAISLAFQYGVPLEALVQKFSHQRFEPAGMTRNREIPIASSIVDYIFRWMGMEWIPGYRQRYSKVRPQEKPTAPAPKATAPSAPTETAAVSSDTRLTTADRFAAEDDDSGGNGKKISEITPVEGLSESGSALDDSSVATATAVAAKPRIAIRAEMHQRMRSFQEDAPSCDVCGAIMVRNGSCYKCCNCGNTSGCS